MEIQLTFFVLKELTLRIYRLSAVNLFHCVLVNCIKWLQEAQLNLHCKITENAAILPLHVNIFSCQADPKEIKKLGRERETCD